MNKFTRYEFEGIVIDIPLIYHERSNKWLEEYPDLIENPIYTSRGMPLVLCIEDVCKNAAPKHSDRLIDCSDCIYFVRAAEGSLLGYCTNEEKKKR